MDKLTATNILVKSSAFLFASAVLAVPLFVAYAQSGILKNPLAYNDLTTLIVKILDVVVKIGGYVAVLAIIWSGFLFVKSQGNDTELTKAKETFWYTIIGVAILLAAKGLALALGNTINAVVK